MKRGCGYLIDCCGNKDLAEYTRSDATKFRDYLFSKDLNGASVARIFGTVRAVINLALSEFGLSIINPFSNVYFDRSAGVTKRLPVQPEDIKKVQEELPNIIHGRLVPACDKDNGSVLKSVGATQGHKVCYGDTFIKFGMNPQVFT